MNLENLLTKKKAEKAKEERMLQNFITIMICFVVVLAYFRLDGFVSDRKLKPFSALLILVGMWYVATFFHEILVGGGGSYVVYIVGGLLAVDFNLSLPANGGRKETP